MARALIAIVTVVSVARVLACVSRLPYPVAVHFDAAGTPNGWMPRRAGISIRRRCAGADVGSALPYDIAAEHRTIDARCTGQ